LQKFYIRQCKHGCKKRRKKKIKKIKEKDDRMLIRSDLTYLNLIFCGPERTEENKRIVDTIHPSTLVLAIDAR
jgi:hypothetical protein